MRGTLCQSRNDVTAHLARELERRHHPELATRVESAL
jgi:hypothetical protein